MHALRKNVKNKRDKLQEKMKKSSVMKLEFGIINNKQLMNDMTKMTEKSKNMEDDLKRLIEQ